MKNLPATSGAPIPDTLFPKGSPDRRARHHNLLNQLHAGITIAPGTHDRRSNAPSIPPPLQGRPATWPHRRAPSLRHKIHSVAGSKPSPPGTSGSEPADGHELFWLQLASRRRGASQPARLQRQRLRCGHRQKCIARRLDTRARPKRTPKGSSRQSPARLSESHDRPSSCSGPSLKPATRPSRVTREADPPPSPTPSKPTDRDRAESSDPREVPRPDPRMQ